MKVTFVSHMAFHDTYGAASALRIEITRLRGGVEGSDLSLSLVAPDAAVCEEQFRRTVTAQAPIQMNYIGALPAWQARPWNAFQDMTAGSRLRANQQLVDLIGDSDIIHMNSLSLSWFPRFMAPALKRHPRFICHVRELANAGAARRLRRDLSWIDGLIYIDPTARSRLVGVIPGVETIPSLELPDPIDTTAPADTDHTVAIRGLAGGRPTVGIAGRVDSVKGFGFMAEVAVSAHRPWCLMAAGRISRSPFRFDSRAEGRRLMRAASISPHQVVYLGEIRDLARSGFYEALDVLVRADAVPTSGLTVLEALARGVPVVLPGRPDDFADHPRLEPFAPLIFFAHPRDRLSYLRAIDAALGTDPELRREIASWSYLGESELGATQLAHFYRRVLSTEESSS